MFGGADRGHGRSVAPAPGSSGAPDCRIARNQRVPRIAEIASGLRRSGIRPWTQTTSALGSGDLHASGPRREGGVGGIRLRSSPPHKPVTGRHPRRPVTGPRAESERSGSALQRPEPVGSSSSGPTRAACARQPASRRAIVGAWLTRPTGAPLSPARSRARRASIPTRCSGGSTPRRRPSPWSGPPRTGTGRATS